MQSTLSLPLGALRDKDLFRSVPGRIVLALAASAFVALCAHLSVPLWFTPVPLTLSNFAVILVGLILGPVTGSAAMVLYLAEGAVGMPVFSPHGPGGLVQLMGPTSGYLLSYPLAAAVAGLLVRQFAALRSRFAAAALASLAATVTVFLMGASWLAYLTHLTPHAAFYLAVAPFLPGEVAKIAAAGGIYSTLCNRPRS